MGESSEGTPKPLIVKPTKLYHDRKGGLTINNKPTDARIGLTADLNQVEHSHNNIIVRMGAGINRLLHREPNKIRVNRPTSDQNTQPEAEPAS